MSTGGVKFQIGKNGMNEGVLQSLELAFKTHKTVRISILKSAVRDKGKVKAIAEEMVEKLGGNFIYTIIGFTIVMRRRGKGEKSKV